MKGILSSNIILFSWLGKYALLMHTHTHYCFYNFNPYKYILYWSVVWWMLYYMWCSWGLIGQYIVVECLLTRRDTSGDKLYMFVCYTVPLYLLMVFFVSWCFLYIMCCVVTVVAHSCFVCRLFVQGFANAALLGSDAVQQGYSEPERTVYGEGKNDCQIQRSSDAQTIWSVLCVCVRPCMCVCVVCVRVHVCACMCVHVYTVIMLDIEWLGCSVLFVIPWRFPGIKDGCYVVNIKGTIGMQVQWGAALVYKHNKFVFLIRQLFIIRKCLE